MNFDEMVETTEANQAAPGRSPVRRRQPSIAVGGLPTVSLLPRELRTAQHVKVVRRALVGVVVLATIVSGCAVAGASMVSASAEQRLAAATAQSQSLTAQVQKFQDVQQLQSQIAVAQAAVTVGSSTEVDWQAQLEAIEADMPSGYVITSMTAASASAVEDYAQGSSPLDTPRAATVQMTLTAPSITQLPIWLRKLRSIPAYADESVAVTSGDGSSYGIALTIQLSPKALINNAKASK